MANPKYSVEFKRAVVEKFLNRGTRPVVTILEEVGISSPTLYQWKADFANILGMKNKHQRPQDRSPGEKLNALIAFENLPLAERGEFLRKQGLHEERFCRKFWIVFFSEFIVASVTSKKQYLWSAGA